jgi:hypothetical protein
MFQPRSGNRQIILAGPGRFFLETVEYVNPIPDLCKINHPVPGSVILLFQLIHPGSYRRHRAAVQRPVTCLQPPELSAQVLSYRTRKTANCLQRITLPYHLDFRRLLAFRTQDVTPPQKISPIQHYVYYLLYNSRVTGMGNACVPHFFQYSNRQAICKRGRLHANRTVSRQIPVPSKTPSSVSNPLTPFAASRDSVQLRASRATTETVTVPPSRCCGHFSRPHGAEETHP